MEPKWCPHDRWLGKKYRSSRNHASHSISTAATAIAIHVSIFQVQSCKRWGRIVHGNIQRRVEQARKIERRICQGTDKIVSAGKFAVVAKALWPINTAACIASIAGKDERTGARWLSGEFEPPGIVLAAILHEITKRD